jgi:hypothetical protein
MLHGFWSILMLSHFRRPYLLLWLGWVRRATALLSRLSGGLPAGFREGDYIAFFIRSAVTAPKLH